MNHIKARTINEAVYKEIDKIIMEGYRTPSRNGDISTIYNVFLELENPKSRHLYLEGRKNNIFATIAETFWVFSGEDKIDPVLSFFLPRAKDFSDDGKTWRGAYGPRFYLDNMMQDVVEQFKNEGIFTRRAVLSIFRPDLDTHINLNEKYGLENTKDRPCNLIMDFFVTPDKKFHMNLKQRSGDVLWGHGSINIFEFTFLQEMMLGVINEELGEDLTLGSYNHHVTNLHLYDFSGSQGYSVLENRLKQKLGIQSFKPLILTDNVHDNKKLFELLMDQYGLFIETKETNFELMMDSIEVILGTFGLEYEDYLIFQYAKVVTAYIAAKNMNLEKGVKTDKIKVYLQQPDEEFYYSILKSPFRKFLISKNGENWE